MTAAFENFLNDYMPADHFFTTYAEIDTIRKQVTAELESENKEITPENVRQVRNQVVKFYDKFFEPRTEQSYDKMTALQSVTAAIDYFMIKIGGNV